MTIFQHANIVFQITENEEVFERDLFITSTKSNVITENETPNYPAKYLDFQCPSIDIVEKLAIFSHEQYINSDASISDMPQNFDEISPLLKTANFNQFFEKISDLISLGYEIVPVDDKREEITSFDDSEIYALGKLEHDHWCDDKYASGWTYGEIKDLDNLTTPYLVPWEELTPEIKELDLYPNKNLPNFVNTAGFKIVRR